MRDIRRDLRERLQEIANRRTELTEEQRRLEAREQCPRALLRDEEALSDQRQPSSSFSSCSRHEPKAGVQLKNFVLGSLADGRAWSLEQLKEHARGLGLATDGVSGRSLNITLVNLQRSGRVWRLSNGRWRLNDINPQMSFDFEGLSSRSRAPDRCDVA